MHSDPAHTLITVPRMTHCPAGYMILRNGRSMSSEFGRAVHQTEPQRGDEGRPPVGSRYRPGTEARPPSSVACAPCLGDPAADLTSVDCVCLPLPSVSEVLVFLGDGQTREVDGLYCRYSWALLTATVDLTFCSGGRPEGCLVGLQPGNDVSSGLSSPVAVWPPPQTRRPH